MVDLRKSLAEERQALRLAYLKQPDSQPDPRPDPQWLLRKHCALVDRTIREVWRDTALAGAALVATGGYGRGELFPGSDVDLLVLLPVGVSDAGITDGDKEKIEKLIGVLWDIGLEIGHSVRSVQGCVESAAEDITIGTTLMEARYLAGSRRLFSELVKALDETRDPLSFFKAKRLEQEQRHAKHQDTPYSLEPNLKEAPGGLRDLHTILWIARASGIGRRWNDLVSAGLLERHEARQLTRHEAAFQDLRIRLHYLAGRREDRMVFDFQNALAAQYGDVDTPDRRASEAMMQRYYRAAKTVTQLNTIVL
ncbi:MAG TPA: nucleotidyltransferase domain-containing protein, partial [Burkholderiales bacterium]|nr:nucleotidyltransferase domain-containing protein [Burkholderiales bacterium]